MFEGAVAGILNRLLGKYVQDLDTENLNVGIFSGNVNLTDLKLKPEALYELDLPIDVKIGTIGRVSLQIPWTGLFTQPVVAHLEDVLVLVGPAISNSHFDPEREKRLMRAAKRKILQDLEAESEILKGPQNFFESLFTAIVNNLQVYVRNVHVRYEDSISSKDGPLACGLCLQSLSIETTNSKWKPSVTPVNASTVYQLMRVESLSLYWNPVATALDDAEIASITPMQYYNWKHYMLTGLDKFSMHQEDFEFLLKPVTCKVKVLINRSAETRVPRLLLDAVLQDSALLLSRRQLLSANNLLASFRRVSLNRKYRHLHPGVPLSKDVRRWWRYACAAVVEQRVRPYTWAAVRRHRQNCDNYRRVYKNTLRSPNDTELKLDLQQSEDSLPIISVVIAREQAKIELLSEEPDRIEVVESEFDWWRSTAGSDSEEEAPVELCVKTERKTLWSHLSSPERKRVCELIGYAEGEPRQDRSKQYIEHKLNFTLANSSLTLMNRSKEVLVVTLTQFLASLETRPSAKAYKVSVRAESVVVEGASGAGDLATIIRAGAGAGAGTGSGARGPPPAPLLAADLERRPHAPPHLPPADYALNIALEPIELLYIEHAFTELINFFQTRPMSAEEVAAELSAAVARGASAGRAALALAAARRRAVQLAVELRGPCLVLPQMGLAQQSGHVMILDISRVTVKSDLQPSNLALEDATCMELEERLYDRLHAECQCQLLFCEWNEPWREMLKQEDSEMHLVPKLKAQVVFSNSIMKDYKLLPRYKLNVSLSSLKLNLSDHLIGLVLDFLDNMPLPAANTVPVSFGDFADYAEWEVEEPAEPELAALAQLLQQDSVSPDPGYGELLSLRQSIVAAYVRRNRVGESTFDKAGARAGFQEATQAFVSSEHSDEDMEIYARSVDLPGFDDNVSASNTINTLMRFVIGSLEARVAALGGRAAVSLALGRVCADVALLRFGPALQLSVGCARLTDHTRRCAAKPLELLASSGDLLNLLYRKVRADCPEFRSQFHSVEQALVADVGPLSAALHAPALRDLAALTVRLADQIQNRSALDMKKIVPQSQSLWNYLTQPEADPPVPSGATKFSYSLRAASVSVKLCHEESELLELRLAELESDSVFRANDRCILRLYLGSLHVDDLSSCTLYPKLVWPDGDKVFEVKYVRTAPRYDGSPLKADGQLRAALGRLQVVLQCTALHQLQQFTDAMSSSGGGAACVASMPSAASCEHSLARRLRALRTCNTRLNLAIEIQAPVLLVPQKPSSPNLLVLNMGELTIENFFKQVSCGAQDAASPGTKPVIDNILMKLTNVTLSRAVMTLAGTLEVQEPILEPISGRCDLKRTLSQQAARELLALEADAALEAVVLNVGQQDLATMLAVYVCNLSEAHYFGNIVPSSPVETAPGDASVKKLQAFLAQGEAIRKEAVLRFTLEGVELKLFTDLDEVLSSPVRDLNHGLAKLTAGEASLHLDYYSDGSAELRASLQSLLIEDIRPDPTIVIKRILECSGGGSTGLGGPISVRRPPVVDASARLAPAAGGGAAQLDVRVDRTRLNLAPAFLLAVARALLLTLPGERVMEEGVVNHGYDCEGPSARNTRPPSCSDSSGYHSATTSIAEETPGLSISIQFRQPELMLFTDLTKAEGHALLLRAELMVDYSSHTNSENLVVSLAGLQIMSKLQSKFKNLPPQPVLKPCDVEYSKSYKGMEEGVKIKMSFSDIEIHIAATTIHTVMDIIEEITSELPVEDKDYRCSMSCLDREEDLWTPRKARPQAQLSLEQVYLPRPPPAPTCAEAMLVTLPSVTVLMELEYTRRVPVFVLKMSGELSLQDWSRVVQGSAALSAEAACYNERLAAWEPVLEPAAGCRWTATASIFQAKAYSMSSRLDPSLEQPEEVSSADHAKKSKKKRGFESETSADECDTDNEMIFIKNPDGREGKHCSVDFGAGHMSLLEALDIEDSDSENEGGLVNKLSTAVGHLFTDDSSADDETNDDDSSEHEPSEVEGSENDEDDKGVSFVDAARKPAKATDHKTVTLQEPVQYETAEAAEEEPALCTYVCLAAPRPLQLTLAPATTRALFALAAAATARGPLVEADAHPRLINDIGPGSTVYLRTSAETDLAGNDKVIAVADYDMDTSRPSTPGGDISGADLLDDVQEKKTDVTDVAEDWDCVFEGGFGSAAMSPAAATEPAARLRRLAALTLSIRLEDFDPLTIVCPQRNVSKLHALHPSKNNTRYYVVVERTSTYNEKRIVVRSPLQIRNETSYALEVLYVAPATDEGGAGAARWLAGALANPFDGKRRLAVLEPHAACNLPLHIAYHCRLYLAPSNFESYRTQTTEAIWWKDLANDVGAPRDLLCPASDGDDNRAFALRIIPVQGVQSHKVSRAIPNLTLRVVAPLAVCNRLPLALELSDAECPEGGAPSWAVHAEAGEAPRAHVAPPRRRLALRLRVRCAATALHWAARFTLTPDVIEKNINLTSECDKDSSNGRQLLVSLKVERHDTWQLFFHAPYWFINKTGLPLQIRGQHSEECYEVTDEPLLWRPHARRGRGGPARVHVRAHHSAWSRAAPLPAAAPALLACAHAERRTLYRLLLTVTLSELCPQLTKIVTLLPYFVVCNDTRRHLRYMEQDEAADLWLDLAPQQVAPFWPLTTSMRMHCKLRDSSLVSQHFPIATNHLTVLRMDKGSAICVEVTGGTDRPFTITFRPYTAGDAPVRVDNFCDDLFLKLHQKDCGQVALLSPYQSLLYTWDDPAKERELLWNIYNNKGKGFVADFSRDGFGEIKVSFQSVKHSTLVATSSVTSKLSSTLKRLTPKSPEPQSSSTDDSDSTDQLENHIKIKKSRKDKVIVYWSSFMDNYQRVFALMQDERLAYFYKMKVIPELATYEVHLSLAGVGLSVCVPSNNTVKELTYVSLTDSLPKWEVNVSRKWKQLSPDLAAWIEEKYQTDQKKCQLKEYIDIDLEKMQMTKPFFSELRRTYQPGVWVQYRKATTLSYFHVKLQRLQIDNQLNDAVFPSVLYPAPLPPEVRSSRGLKPAIEFEALKQYRYVLNQDVYKYVRVLIREHCLNLDRGFVNHVFDILNHWKIEEKPAVRLRADLALVHMPLPIIAMKSQTSAQKNVVFEYIHLSPLKVVLSLSSRGYLAESSSPSWSLFGIRKENRPKLFNSDLLEYLFNSWGSSLCDMKDVVLKMSYLELRNAPLSIAAAADAASRHYWTQLAQQFHVLVLGLSILGNPYSAIGDLASAMRRYYEPCLGRVGSRQAAEAAAQAAPAARARAPPTGRGRRPAIGEEETLELDIPRAVLEADRVNPASVALALTGLIARPTIELCREAARASLARQFGANSIELALRASAERSGGRLVARQRLPRHCHLIDGVQPYSQHEALGQQLLWQLARDPVYLGHAHLTPASALLLSDRHVYVVRASGAGAWRVEWAAPLARVRPAPAAASEAASAFVPARLVLAVRQDEALNYFATDEKVIEVTEPEILDWLKNKIETALILALEDQRCPDE